MSRWIRFASIPLFAVALIAANNAVDTTDAISVQGTVVNSDGQPVRGATITAFDDDNKSSISIFSEEDGSFEFASLPTGVSWTSSRSRRSSSVSTRPARRRPIASTRPMGSPWRRGRRWRSSSTPT